MKNSYFQNVSFIVYFQELDLYKIVDFFSDTSTLFFFLFM